MGQKQVDRTFEEIRDGWNAANGSAGPLESWLWLQVELARDQRDAALARAERAEASRDHARTEMARLGGALELALTDTERERDAALVRVMDLEQILGNWQELLASVPHVAELALA